MFSLLKGSIVPNKELNSSFFLQFRKKFSHDSFSRIRDAKGAGKIDKFLFGWKKTEQRSMMN
jgi:hypothetical protein